MVMDSDKEAELNQGAFSFECHNMTHEHWKDRSLFTFEIVTLIDDVNDWVPVTVEHAFPF